MLEFSRYLDLVSHDTMRAIGALRSSGPDARVPGCPQWAAGDLLTHLVEMNDIWAWLVTHRPADFTDGFESAEVPDDHRERLDLLDATNHRLLEALRASGPGAEVCYFGEGAPALRAARLMAVETLIHSRDAEEAAGLTATAVPQDVAADVVDHQLAHLTDANEARWHPEAVTLTSTDTGDTWTVLVAAQHGDGTLRLVDQAPVGAEVAAPAAVLAPWLFARTHAACDIRVGGDTRLVRVLQLALGHEGETIEAPARRRWFRR